MTQHDAFTIILLISAVAERTTFTPLSIGRHGFARGFAVAASLFTCYCP